MQASMYKEVQLCDLIQSNESARNMQSHVKHILTPYNVVKMVTFVLVILFLHLHFYLVLFKG